MQSARFIALALILVSLAGCHTTSTGPPSWQDSSDQIRQAGERLGLPVRAEKVASISQGGTTVVTAAAANLETVPATQLRGGVDLAVAYFDSATLPVPRGFYRLRAFADVVEVGTVDGRIDLLDESGRVAGQLPATVEVHSLTVPASARGVTEVAIQTQARQTGGCPIQICYLCTNGHWVCYCAEGLETANNRTSANP